ncbi:MAG: hypothetical protein H6825_09135 [Planctomycetes bacterium]|nr:hypothetical protein [Planctomycetota bacterium]
MLLAQDASFGGGFEHSAPPPSGAAILDYGMLVWAWLGAIPVESGLDRLTARGRVAPAACLCPPSCSHCGPCFRMEQGGAAVIEPIRSWGILSHKLESQHPLALAMGVWLPVDALLRGAAALLLCVSAFVTWQLVARLRTGTRGVQVLSLVALSGAQIGATLALQLAWGRTPRRGVAYSTRSPRPESRRCSGVARVSGTRVL